jgi:flavorubredoxin
MRFAAIIGSYGWGSKVAEQIAGLIPNLKVEVLDTILAKGHPGKQDFMELDKLADAIWEKHGQLQDPD